MFLSVQVPPTAARAILDTDAEALNALLTAMGPDRDLGRRTGPARPGVACLGLESRPVGIGRTKATKLIARTRPRLFPIWVSVVMGVLGTARAHLNPVREALRADDGAVHGRLLRIRAEAGLPEEISVLWVFDVIAWRDDTNRGLGQRVDQEG